ncbi:GL19787 [Drosophila persimilis]|uniref:GL19787 n=1 Tax=Drosophila persimilis TaxID=7234 RepID=B4GYJ6_DROPE|nr:GL19787 [Drosophila persimilis]
MAGQATSKERCLPDKNKIAKCKYTCWDRILELELVLVLVLVLGLPPTANTPYDSASWANKVANEDGGAATGDWGLENPEREKGNRK